MHFLLTFRGTDTGKAQSTNGENGLQLCPIEVSEWQYWDDDKSEWMDAGTDIQLQGSAF